jgi:hypothetical protein
MASKMALVAGNGALSQKMGKGGQEIDRKTIHGRHFSTNSTGLQEK